MLDFYSVKHTKYNFIYFVKVIITLKDSTLHGLCFRNLKKISFLIL